MKHGLKWLIPALLALVMLLSLTAAFAEEAATVYGMATKDQVAVRKQPGKNYNYWFRLDTGFVCEILDVVEKDGVVEWYKVNTHHPDPSKDNTYIGYVLATSFRPLTAEETEEYLNGDAALLTPSPEVTPTPTPGYQPGDEEDSGAEMLAATGEITASGTNFRLTASTEGELIGKLNAGTVVELLTMPDQIGADYWYKVRYNGQEGYIQSPFIRVLTVGYTPAPAPSAFGYAKLIYDTANLRDEPGGITQATWRGMGSLLQIVGTARPAENHLWYPVYYGIDNTVYYVRDDVITIVDADGDAVETTPAPDYGSIYGYVITTKGGVNLRLKPGGETIFQIPRGKIVPCIGYPEDPVDSSYTWYYVQYDGMRGYLRGDCVRVCTADGGEVAATPTPIPTQTPTGAYGYVKLTKGGVNLREKPAGTSQCQLQKDLILPLIGAVVPSGRYDWYPVMAPDGRTGYVRSDCIMLCDAQGNKVDAVVTPTPSTPSAPSTPTTPSLSTYGYVMITEPGTNLRNAVAGNTIYQLKKNTVWPMIGISVTYGQYTWYPIQADGYTGFVRGDCAFKLSATQELSYLSGNGVPEETPAPTPTLSNYVITVLDYVNLRATPSRDAAAPYKVRTGTVMAYNTVKPVGTSNWYRVVYNNTEVWVLGTCVRVMTTAEYEAWLKDNPSAAPDQSAALGYLITVEAGVNVRGTAAGSTIVDRLSKGTIIPYFTDAFKVGSYKWYEVRTPDGKDGYIRSDMVEKCTEDGAPLPPTPPSGSTGGSTGPQEATYTTLRLGSTGTAVYNLVYELKQQGYYTGAQTSSYTSEVRAAVIAFQAAKGLTVDGIAGNQTQHALYGTVPPGTADPNNLSFTFYPVEKIDWYTGGIQQLWAKGANYKVYDVKTGIVWWAHRWSGAAHADIEPLTAADTARLCQIYGVDDAQEIYDKNMWQRRPCLVTIGTRTFACSLDGMPHNPDGDTIDNNNMTGQICMHFTNSKGHESGKVSTSHQEAVEYAYDWAKARYGAK